MDLAVSCLRGAARRQQRGCHRAARGIRYIYVQRMLAERGCDCVHVSRIISGGRRVAGARSPLLQRAALLLLALIGHVWVGAGRSPVDDRRAYLQYELLVGLEDLEPSAGEDDERSL